MALGYVETESKLRIRIRAHKEFANLDLEGWIARWLGPAEGKRLLELGCGDGNFFSTYAQALGPAGQIIGFDVSPELLNLARRRGMEVPTPVLVMKWNFDHHPFPLLDQEVDFVVAPYSAYYTTNVNSWIEEAFRLLKGSGRILLLGPTVDNAKELYDLNELVSGVRSIEEIDKAGSRLEREFLPALKAHAGCEVRSSLLDRRIEFPSPEEFAGYYFATWLFEKTQQQVGKKIELEAVIAGARKVGLSLNKQITCIEVLKKAF